MEVGADALEKPCERPGVRVAIPAGAVHRLSIGTHAVEPDLGRGARAGGLPHESVPLHFEIPVRVHAVDFDQGRRFYAESVAETLRE
jgi:hypothetical protein